MIGLTRSNGPTPKTSSHARPSQHQGFNAAISACEKGGWLTLLRFFLMVFGYDSYDNLPCLSCSCCSPDLGNVLADMIDLEMNDIKIWVDNG